MLRHKASTNLSLGSDLVDSVVGQASLPFHKNVSQFLWVKVLKNQN